MALTIAPEDWVADWAEADGDITIPLASLPELSEAEADGESGDIRSVVHAFNEALYTEMNSLPTGDRPTRWLLTKSASTNTVTGITTVQYVHTLYLETEVGGMQVADEPA